MSDETDYLSSERRLIEAKLGRSNAGVLFKTLWRRRKSKGLSAKELAMKAGWLKPGGGETHPHSIIDLVYQHIRKLRSNLAGHNKQRQRENSNDYRFEILLPDNTAKDGYKLRINPRKFAESSRSEQADGQVANTLHSEDHCIGTMPNSQSGLLLQADAHEKESVGNSYGSSVPFQLRPLPLCFFRRPEVHEFCDKIEDSHHSLFTIWGMPGVGKSTFALAIAHNLQMHFPDGALFLDMLGTSEYVRKLTSRDAMRHLVNSFRGDFEIAGEPRRLADAYFEVANQKRLIFVLDNVATKEQIEPLLPLRNSLVIVTS